MLICTGGVGRHPPSEAEVSAKIARECGIPRDQLLIEQTSTSTIENLRNAHLMMSAKATAIIITDRFHSKRALMLARLIGMEAKLVVPDKSYPRSRTSVYIKGWLREIVAIAALLVFGQNKKSEKSSCD